nr:glycosyltransferase family 1 protein [Microlunatus panaciterrae]
MGRHDGISRYTAGIVTELGQLNPVTMLVSDLRQLEMLPELPYQLVSAPTSPLEPLVARQVNRLQPDVVFTPMQTMGSFGRRYRLVLTVHDLIYYRHPAPPPEFAAWLRLIWRLYHLTWWPQRLLLNRADAVVAVSETTRRLLSEHQLTRRPVTVVPNAAELSPAAGQPSPDRSRARSLVYMGTFMTYKNVETLVTALRLLPGYRLHLMSRVSDADRSRLQGLAPPDADLVFHDGATDETYHRTLAGAQALVSASRDEGFGIPLVEAMAHGTPVVVSDIEIFREIGGPAAVFADPDDPATFAAAIRGLEDATEWNRRSTAALAQAGRYSWHRSAQTLLDLCRRLGGEDG